MAAVGPLLVAKLAEIQSIRQPAEQQLIILIDFIEWQVKLVAGCSLRATVARRSGLAAE